MNKTRFELNDVWQLLGADALAGEYVSKSSKDSIEVEGFKVYRQSLRYKLFYQKGTTCVCCGRIGTHFQLDADRQGGNVENRRHFNLYTDDGMLMTKDHIKPRRLGGEDTISNMQVMCKECNEAKGDKYNVPIDGYLAIHSGTGEEKKFLTEHDAICFVADLRKVFNSGARPSRIARRVLAIADEFRDAVKSGTAMNYWLFTKSTFMWEGKSYEGPKDNAT